MKQMSRSTELIFMKRNNSGKCVSLRNKSSAVAEIGDRLATIDMDQKEGAAVPLSGGSWAPSAYVPSGIWIHPAVWPQQISAENWGLCPFGGELGPHLTQCGVDRVLPPTKWHLVPSSRLATTDMD